MADSLPSDIQQVQPVAQPVKRKKAPAFVEEYICGYTVDAWMDSELARHGPFENAIEAEAFHGKLSCRILSESGLSRLAQYRSAIVDKKVQPFVALASNMSRRAMQLPPEEKYAKLKAMLGTDEPPKWYKRY